MDSTLFSFRWIVSDSHETERDLLHNLAINRPSSSEDQFFSEEFRKGPLARKPPPFHSLFGELHTLSTKIQNYCREIGWIGAATISDIQKWTYLLQRELMLQQMVSILLQNHGDTAEALSRIHGDTAEALSRIHGDTAEALNRIQTDALNRIQTDALNRMHTVVEKVGRKKKLTFRTLVKLLMNRSRSAESRRILEESFVDFEYRVSEFLGTVDQKIKPHLKEACVGMVHHLLHGKHSSREYDIVAFMYIILLQLKDLENLKPNKFAGVRKQMETLQVVINVACIIARKEANSDVNLQNFLAYFGHWVDIAAALVSLYWVNLEDEELFAIVCPSLQKFSILELVEAYIVVIKAFKPSNPSQILVMREIVRRFTNLVAENLIIGTEGGFEMLREGLALWIALVVDPPRGDAEFEKLICAKIKLLVDQAETLIRALCLDIADRRKVLCDFLQKINDAESALRQLQVDIPGLTMNHVPQTNRRGFFDFWLANLQKKLEQEADMFPFEKHLIATVHKELTVIRPFLMDIFELQDEHNELRDVWVRASNVAYLVNYVTDSCLSSIDVPVWCNLMHLSSAIEQIPFLKVQVSEIRKNEEKYHNKHAISGKLSSKLVLPGKEQANATTKEEVQVGFEHEEERIIDRLVAEEVGFDIVAIVGMPGQGKTTLAKRVYKDSRIKFHFHKYAWCCISEAYDTKRILLDILDNVGQQASSVDLCQEDLCDRLRKCLKGQRYLVVLDDIWDAKAWHELQLSFPNDNNGSRILLTSRSRNVALEAKASCCLVELHPLSHEESWKLLRMKVFAEDFCPPALSDIGKTTAENCKGLPLSIVVVASLLKKDKNVNSWKQISKSLKAEIESEGCMNIVDLSYKHLPEYLKPCFLYLGAFREDEIINAKKLFEFWIAEGFVKNDGMKRMEVVAEEYLMDLVDRSLVFVAERSSTNGIKKFHVHDLVRDFCLMKAKEGRFLANHAFVDEKNLVFFLYLKRFIPTSLRSLRVSVGALWNLSLAPGFLKRFKLIEVLDLRDVLVTEADFHEITQFIHLRLLAVNCRGRFLIPSSIVNLLRLEVLCVKNQFADPVLPNVVFEMKNLRQIHVPDCRLGQADYLRDSSLPLTNLETFSLVEFSNILSFERAVQKFPTIQKLGLGLPSCVHLSSYFMKLESLKLRCLCGGYVDVISPSNLDFPLTLKKLNLEVRSLLSADMLSLIGKLSNLEVLKLQALIIEHERWDVEDDEFLKLKYLKFINSNVREWNTSDESFPRLEQLVVHVRRHVAGELPARFGAITTLKKIQVRCFCEGAISNSFQQIVDDQKDSGNESLQYSIILL